MIPYVGQRIRVWSLKPTPGRTELLFLHLNVLNIASTHDKTSVAVKYHSTDASTFRNYGLDFTIRCTSIHLHGYIGKLWRSSSSTLGASMSPQPSVNSSSALTESQILRSRSQLPLRTDAQPGIHRGITLGFPGTFAPKYHELQLGMSSVRLRDT